MIAPILVKILIVMVFKNQTRYWSLYQSGALIHTIAIIYQWLPSILGNDNSLKFAPKEKKTYNLYEHSLVHNRALLVCHLGNELS